MKTELWCGRGCRGVVRSASKGTLQFRFSTFAMLAAFLPLIAFAHSSYAQTNTPAPVRPRPPTHATAAQTPATTPAAPFPTSPPVVAPPATAANPPPAPADFPPAPAATSQVAPATAEPKAIVVLSSLHNLDYAEAACSHLRIMADIKDITEVLNNASDYDRILMRGQTNFVRGIMNYNKIYAGRSGEARHVGISESEK